MMRRTQKVQVVVATMVVSPGGLLYGAGDKPAAAEGLFDDVNIGLVSIGGRATYFDPKEGDAN